MNELFLFEVANKRYLYTNSAVAVTLGNDTFIPAAITRKEISKENMGSDARIVTNFDLEPINLFKDFNPSVGVFIKIMKSDGTLVFLGKILGVEFNLKNGEAVAKCGVLNGILKSKIPVRTYSASCAFECFDANCGLKEDDYKLILTGAVISDDHKSITHPDIALKGVDFYLYGYVKYNLQYSYISGGSGDTIKLLFPIRDLSGSGVIYVYAGCDKLISTCKNKFNNSKNYGGFPFIPSKNPVTSGY